MSESKILRYSPSALRADYLRCAFLGAVGGGGMIFGGSLADFLVWISAALLVLSIIGFVVVGSKHATTIEVSPWFIKCSISPSNPFGPLGPKLMDARVSIVALDRMGLRASGGFRQRNPARFYVRLVAGRDLITVEEDLEGFDEVLAWSLRAARERNLKLDPQTEGCLQDLGLWDAIANAPAMLPAGRYREGPAPE